MVDVMLNIVRNAAEDLPGGRELNFYSFLGGLIRLSNLSEDEVKETFEEQEIQEEILKCQAILKQKGLMEDAVWDAVVKVLINAVCLDNRADDFMDFLREFLGKNEEAALSDFIPAALGQYGEELHNIQKGTVTIAEKNRETLDSFSTFNTELYQFLNDNIRGQSEAIRLFVRGLFQGKILRTVRLSSNRPRSIFLLSGPAGSGKASLVETTAAALTRELLTIDLNEYAMDGSGAAAWLFDPVIEGKDAPPPGKVTKFIYLNPQGIVLFKNIEHINPKTLTKLSEILDTGIIDSDDAGCKPVSLANNTIIFTATLGDHLSADNLDKNVSVLPQPMILDVMKREMAARDLNPLLQGFFDSYFSANNIIMMNYVSLYYLSKMVEDTFADFSGKMQEIYGINVKIDPLVTNVFLYTQSDASNARATVRQAENFLKSEIYEFSRHLQKGRPNGFENLQDITFKVKPPAEKGPVRSLLVNETVSEVLVIADKKNWQGVQYAPGFHLNFASNYDEAVEILKQKDIRFCVIDLYYGQNSGSRQHYLSLDDVESVGLNCFENIRKNIIGLPIYLVNQEDMDQEDKVTFIQRGAREFIDLGDTQEKLTQQIDAIVQTNYVQGKRAMMNAKNKVLTFNTAQEISEDGKHAIITFYEFSTRGTNLEGYDLVYDTVTYHPEGKIDDYIGSAEVKKELKYLSTYLTNPRQFVVNEGAAPGGILLFGSEGVGKSVLARELAGEADATYIAPEINTVQSLNPEYLEDLFKVAKKCAPSVIFINHLDRIGLDTTNAGERLRNIIKQNLGNFAKDVQHPVLFVGAMDFDEQHLGRDNTNLDVPLLNHLSYKINVPLPDKEERKEFLLKLLSRAKVTAISEDALENILQRTVWNTFDDLEEFFKVAGRIAKRQNKPMDDEIFIGALDEFSVGGTTERDEKLHWEVAIHEAGHAYIQWKSGNRSAFATITPRGDYGGYVMAKIEEKETLRGTKEEYIWKIRMGLASRAAEIVFLGRERGINAGISSDFQVATRYALDIVCQLGMDEDWLVSMPPEVLLQSSLAGDVMKKVNNLLRTEFQNTMLIVIEGKKAVEALAKALLDKNQLTGTEIDTIIEQAEKKKDGATSAELCSKCGKPVDSSWKFCRNCGNKL